MRVLITGAAGRIGRNVTRELIEVGFDVVATDAVYRRDLGFSLRVADLTDRLSIYPLMEGCDSLIHLGNLPNSQAAQPAQRVLVENTAINTYTFAAAAELGLERVVFISSIQATTGADGTQSYWKPLTPSRLSRLPLDGDLPRNPGFNYYGQSKAFGEQMLEIMAQHDESLRAITLRLPYVWPTDPEMIRRHLHPFRPHDHRLQECLCHLTMADAVHVIRAALEKASPGYRTYFPAVSLSVEGLTPTQIAEQHLAHIPVRGPLDGPGGLVDVSALERDLGWTPTLPVATLPRADD
ncbi:MAG: NAD(P)-dependent oxidoreductase [Planctomycetota bacterium]